MKGVSPIRLLVEDCIARRLTEKEAIGTPDDPNFKSYFLVKLGRNISRSTYYKHRNHIFSKDGLQMYFNDHSTDGFVKDQKMRKMEMETVMDDLMKQWAKLLNKPDPHPNLVAGLTHAITDASKSLRQISLDNPVISAIKIKVDTIGARDPGEASTIDYTKGTAFS